MGDGKKFISEGMHLGSYTGEGRSLCGECEAHEVRTRGEVVSHFFFAPFSKILISKDLWDGDGSRSCQNIEPQGLACKIFQNKDLALGLEPKRLAGEYSLGSAVCID
jgi:hypothetical protein